MQFLKQERGLSSSHQKQKRPVRIYVHIISFLINSVFCSPTQQTGQKSS